MRSRLSCFPSSSGKLIWKMSPLVLGEVVRVLLAHWLPIASILVYLPMVSNLYIKNRNLSLNFLFPFWILNQILNVLKKRMIDIANVFSKLETLTILLRPLSKKRFFRTRFDSQHAKASQILTKSQWKFFYHVFHHSRGSWFGKCLT